MAEGCNLRAGAIPRADFAFSLQQLLLSSSLSFRPPAPLFPVAPLLLHASALLSCRPILRRKLVLTTSV